MVENGGGRCQSQQKRVRQHQPRQDETERARIDCCAAPPKATTVKSPSPSKEPRLRDAGLSGVQAAPDPPDHVDDLSPDTLRAMYRTMLLSRRIDDKELQLKHQSLIYFQIAAPGTRRSGRAAGQLLKPGADWFYPAIAIARCVCRWASPPTRCSSQASARATTRPAEGVRCPHALGQPPPQHRVAIERHRHPVRAGDRLRRHGRLCERIPESDRESSFEPDESVCLLARRRVFERR